MTNSTWKITTFDDGKPVATAEGLSHTEAVVALRRAMYGSDPLSEANAPANVAVAPASDHDRAAATADPHFPVAA